MSDQIWILIGKKLSGEASPEELKLIDDILEHDPAAKYQFKVLDKIWKEKKQQETAEEENRWNRFESRLTEAEKGNLPPQKNMDKNSTEARRYRHFAFGALFAIIILALATKIIYLPEINKDENKTSEIAAPMGAITKIHLSDGTKVWLNAGSKLVYKKSFGASQREVSLTGEAFFDVTKDARHPFIVTTPMLRIKVLGTRFNLKAYPNDKLSEATLLSGRIDLTVLKTPEKEIVMKPLEKVLVKNESSSVKNLNETADLPLIVLSRIHPVSIKSMPAELQWTDNVLVFDEENLEDLTNRMERRFNVFINIKSAALRKTKFTGRFKDEKLEEAFSELQAAKSFHYKIADNQVTIY